MDHPRWHKKSEIADRVSFYSGDYGQLAMERGKGFWYYTKDKNWFYGPFRNLKLADRAWRYVNPK